MRKKTKWLSLCVAVQEGGLNTDSRSTDLHVSVLLGITWTSRNDQQTFSESKRLEPINWLACRVIGWLANWWLAGWLAGWLGGWVAGWLGGWLAHSLIHSLTHSLTHPLTDWLEFTEWQSDKYSWASRWVAVCPRVFTENDRLVTRSVFLLGTWGNYKKSFTQAEPEAKCVLVACAFVLASPRMTPVLLC